LEVKQAGLPTGFKTLRNHYIPIAFYDKRGKMIGKTSFSIDS